MTDDDKPDPTRPEQKGTATPSISLPKGGGAIRGIGEKFGVNAVTGTGSTSVPIATSPGRSGFGPKLSLSYDSGSGNGPFGFGWSLDLPQITRRTDKGLPRYHDAHGTETDSDIFLLSHAEDLVPLLQPNSDRFVDVTSVPGYIIHRYRPRIEGLFARIERWTRRSDGDIHWRSITRDNVLTLYGKDSHARIVDPADPTRVFTWLMCETRDDRGNAVIYEYKHEDGVGVDLTRAHERNRGAEDDPRRTANRYLKRVRYGNRVPLLDDAGQRPRFLTDAQIRGAGWMFELVLDYGEHDRDAPTSDDSGPWATRFDAFSTYRATFEVRSSRLCRRALMFHHFPGEAGGDESLVRSTDFTYSTPQDPAHPNAPAYSFLKAVTHVGYRRRDDGTYLKRSMPPVEYEYTQPVVQDSVRVVDAESLQNLPIGLDGNSYRWVDLHGEGIPGILSEQGDAWFYKRNVSPISGRPVAFTPVERVPIKPNVALVGGSQFMDLASEGRPDLVVMDGPIPGFYRHDDHEGWEPFRSFRSRLNRDTRDPNVRFLDVDGDGLIDVLITEDDAFVWHPSLGTEGFGPARRVRKDFGPHEERGPRLLFDDAAQSIYLADMSGDGLTDLVRIRNGEVSYWPNLGYGNFGAKVTMDRSPHFDNAEQFEQGRVRLADIDGSGTTDIIYLHRDGVHLYFNQSGNGFSAPRRLRVFPPLDDLVSITTVDLFGNGTACLVWSSPLAGDAQRPMRYVDLMGGDKPHLLVKSINNLGAETRVKYVSSTKFYLQDKHAGTPWITKLPFPVHVVERTETVDAISGNRFVTRYSYHHGFYDGVEREFRGFGRVDQIDTEEFAALTADGTLPPATNEDPASQVPPVLTKTWFHTGIFLGRDHVSDFFAGLLDRRDVGEYYREPGLTDAEARQVLLPDTVLPPDLTLEEEREAGRSLKGTMLRLEIYALDGTPKAGIPYTVTEQNFTVVRAQPLGGNRHAVFFTHPREAITTHYERNPADPRIGHALTLDVDDFGNVRKSLAIAYGRRVPSADRELTDADRAKQAQLQITRTDNRFTNAHLAAIDHYRAPLAAEARTYELTGLRPESSTGRFRFDEWTRDGFALLLSGVVIPYEQAPDRITKQQRLIEDVRARYRKDDLTSLLPLGEVESLALPGQSYKLALTPGVLAQAFKRARAGQPDEDLLPDPAPLLEGKGADQGGYVAIDGNWWIPSSLAFFDPEADAGDPASTAARELGTARQHFFLPRKIVDPFGHGSVVEYDTHDLLLAQTVDALGNTTSAVNDYRVLQAALVTDPNRNRAAAAFDALGLMVATAVMGKDGENLGDLLEGFDADPAIADLQAFVADPQTTAAAFLGKATTRFVYDLDRYVRAGQPPFAASLARETHFEPARDGQTKIQLSFSFSDGFGREVQKKTQAEPGEAPRRLAPLPLPGGDLRPGDLVRDGQGQVVEANATRRWVGSGRTVFNNKGKPVKQYEPFFSVTHLYEPERDVTDNGVSPVLFYDPVERVVATLHPNQTYEKVVFDPWQQTTFDVNDTVAPSGNETGDPRTDPDIKGYVQEHFKTQPNWETWHTQRIGNALGTAERDAARKAEAHANTPTVAHLDTLGRPFLTLVHNRVVCPGHNLDGTEAHFAARVSLDIEGNQREVRDALNRAVMRYDSDLLGIRIHQSSMEAGERWMLGDALGKPIRAWNSRGVVRRLTYDELRRPAGLFVTENGAERLAERTVYGEGQSDEANHRGQVFQRFDGAGVVTNIAYDYKGNLLEHRCELLPDYKLAVNWLQNPAATDGTFTSRTTFDALSRPLTVTSPDGSVYRPTFNEASLLDKVEVRLRRAGVPTAFVTNIDYNAKGQREQIDYGNGATTTYEYDPLTFRLTQLRTTRPSSHDATASQLFRDPSVVQDLRYSYDPIGNITRIEDAALRTFTRGGQSIEPMGAYTYDAIYRLVEALGREHTGQNTFDFNPPNGDYRDYPFIGHRAHPNDLQALQNYMERYEYDSVGNFAELAHRARGAGWTRRYDYEENSLLETGKKNNRLTRTAVGGGLNHVEPYTHDDHGNMTSMPHLPAMVWDFKDELQQADLGGGGTAYYVYDSAGQRARKVIESQNGRRQQERLYLGGFEIYREYNGVGISLERESLHVLDDKQRIALVETQTIQNGNALNGPVTRQRYQLGNHLGSASVELDKDGALIAYEEYHCHGTTSFQAGHSAAEVSLKRYRYTGKERDQESGLSYHGARYYAPWIARWTAFDPAGMGDGPCPYAYARSNPVRLKDPNGMQSADEIGMGMMWTRMGQEFSAMIESVVGGRAFVDPARNRVEYSGPRNGVGGLVGGVAREATFRAVPIEDQPSAASLVGMEVGGGLVPIAGPANRLATGETTTGLEASRGWAAVELVIDVVPLALEVRAVRAGRQAAVLGREVNLVDDLARAGVRPPGAGGTGSMVGEPFPENPFPHVQQRQPNWCGAACGQMSAERLGVQVEQAELAASSHFEPRSVFGKQVVSEGGFQTTGLQQALSDVAPVSGRQWSGGVIPQDISTAEGLRTHLNGYLKSSDASVILRVEGGDHWIIVDSVLEDGRIAIRDPRNSVSSLVTPEQLSNMRPTGDAVFSFKTQRR